MEKYMLMVLSLIILSLMFHKIGEGMGYIKSLKAVISFLGTTGITVMTAGSGGTSMCLLQTLKQRQGLYVFHSQGSLGCDVVMQEQEDF